MSSNENIFEKACLIQLSTSVWQGTRALDSEVMQRLNNNGAWLKGRKYLINPELLGPVKTVVHRARREAVITHTLPFPITGLYLVPKESIETVESKLQFFRDRFWEKVNEFESIYDEARQEARQILGELFDSEEYPDDITTKFRFEWKFVTLTMPGKDTILSPEIYEQEKQKFISMVDEAREMGIRALHQELSDNVAYLMDRLSGNNGKGKILKSAMFNRMNAFLEDLETKNVFNDQRLRELAEEAKSVINNADSNSLKYSESLRNHIHDQMSQLKDSIDESIEDIPRRRIRMESADDMEMDYPAAQSA